MYNYFFLTSDRTRGQIMDRAMATYRAKQSAAVSCPPGAIPTVAPAPAPVVPQHRSRGFWYSNLGLSLLIITALLVCFGFPALSIMALQQTQSSIPTMASLSTPAATPIPPNSKKVGTAVVTCSGLSSSSPQSALITQQTTTLLSSFINNDGIGNAINGCKQPQLAQGNSESASSTSNSSGAAPDSPTTTFVCKSQLTLIVMITLGDRPLQDLQTGQWYALGRMPLPATDHVIRNPLLDPRTGLRTGDNMNVYILSGHVSVKLPGTWFLTVTGLSSDAARILQGIYYSPTMDHYHLILKDASQADADLVAKTIGVSLVDEEVDY